MENSIRCRAVLPLFPWRERERQRRKTMASNGKAPQLAQEWATNPRWDGVERPYSGEDVERLRGSIHIEHSLAPIGADAEAGFGGTLNAFELMKSMIEAGAACVHFEDQLSSAKKCGHLGGKVLVPSSEAVQKLIAARLASDVLGVPTLILARTDADSAHLLTSDIDPHDREFL